MIELHFGQLRPLLKHDLDMDLEVAPANPRKDERVLRDFNFGWLECRVEMICYALYKLSCLFLVSRQG